MFVRVHFLPEYCKKGSRHGTIRQAQRRVFSNNSSNGVDVALQVTNPITVSLTLRNVVASNNAGTGVTVTGPSNFTHVLITKSTITGNGFGIGGAQILSFGDNNIADNTVGDGTPTGLPVPLK